MLPRSTGVYKRRFTDFFWDIYLSNDWENTQLPGVFVVMMQE
jgi:hypothetical protein